MTRVSYFRQVHSEHLIVSEGDGRILSGDERGKKSYWMENTWYVRKQ